MLLPPVLSANCTCLISNVGFPMEKLSQVVYYLKEYYPAFVFDCKDYDTLYELMTHDKKNEAGIINFTLLSQVVMFR